MTMATMNTTKVMKALKVQDQQTVDQVFETWRQPLVRYIHRFVRDSYLAEDLAQETLIKAYKNLDRLDTKGNLNNWLFTIARNLTLDYLRRKRREKTVFVEDLEKEIHRDPADSACREEEAAILRKAMKSLNTRQCYALVQKEAEDDTFREIGEALNCTISHVRTLIHHAKMILQEKLSHLHSTLPKAG